MCDNRLEHAEEFNKIESKLDEHSAMLSAQSVLLAKIEVHLGNFGPQISDHETRLRTMEAESNQNKNLIRGLGAVVATIITIIVTEIIHKGGF